MEPSQQTLQIFCLRCDQETIATKYSRRHPGLAYLCGVNQCMRCGAIYDAPLPNNWQGHLAPRTGCKPPTVEYVRKRRQLQRMAKTAFMQQVRQATALERPPPHRTPGPEPEGA